MLEKKRFTTCQMTIWRNYLCRKTIEATYGAADHTWPDCSVMLLSCLPINPYPHVITSQRQLRKVMGLPLFIFLPNQINIYFLLCTIILPPLIGLLSKGGKTWFVEAKSVTLSSLAEGELQENIRVQLRLQRTGREVLRALKGHSIHLQMEDLPKRLIPLRFKSF